MSSVVIGLQKVLRAKRNLLSGSLGATDCLRLCAGAADGCEGLIVDRFGSLVVATNYAPVDADAGAALLSDLRTWLPSSDVIVKTRAPSGTNPSFALQTYLSPRTTPIVGTEQGLRFEIGTDPNHDFGIYLDAAKARQHVRTVATGQNVLNLFSYTGAFGIAAAAGGATSITNVDPNRDYHAWALRNARLNGVNLRVLPDTAQDFLKKYRRRLERSPHTPPFDLIIVDPPAFGAGRGNERILRLLWPQIFDSLRVMSPRHIVLMCNDKYFRSKKNFSDLVMAELGTQYRFTRLGTHLHADDLKHEKPDLNWKAGLEDPHYVEPVVLAGSRITARPR